MPVFNYAGQEINAKIVYYGPGLSGKTTNLEFIYAKLPRENKGKMVSMKTRTDRTLFFDFLPVDIGEINGMKVRFLLYTVPGQVYYNATRKLVLKGADAVVFVADSAPDRMQDNRESLQNLEDNLNDLGMTLKEIPWVLQLNKRDLPNALDRAAMERELNVLKTPCFEATASEGSGVYETFEGMAKLVLKSMQKALRDPERAREVRETGHEERIAVEVVAKSQRENSAEADGTDYRYSADRPEESHASVSEFVDSALTEVEKVREKPAVGVDLGATRGGYEDYGHVVDLNGDEAASATQAEEPSAEGDIVNVDPIERFKAVERSRRKDTAGRAPAAKRGAPVAGPEPVAAPEAGIPAAAVAADAVGTAVQEPESPRKPAGASGEKTIRVPVRLTREEASKEIRLNLVIEIEVT